MFLKASEMINSIKHAFEKSIPKTEWMDEKTKEKALEKVRRVYLYLGCLRCLMWWGLNSRQADKHVS